MSYILDALRKAERERDAAQIPTLTTVHDLRGAPSRRLPWIILGASVVGISLLAGIGLFLMKPSSEPGPSKIDISGVAEEAGATPIPDRGEEVPTDLAAPRQVVQPKVQPVLSSGTGIVPDVKHAPPSTQVQKEPASPSPAAKEPTRPQAPSKTSPSETTESTPTPATPPSKPLDLNEAVAKMNMTILFYSETKSERMVFINGRRYAEGDYVDGFYLIDSITPEGAWLSYQGNRAILRPKAK